MNPRILIVEARFYEHISNALLDGATAALDAADAQFERIIVPGALEIPSAIAIAAHASMEQARAYDGYVALGCVIRGETYHFEIVANESARGILDVQLETGVPIANGVLTTSTEDQARSRAPVKGAEAARVAIEMANTLRAIAG